MMEFLGASPMDISTFFAGLQADFNNFIAQVFAFLPNLIAALLILLIGYIVAKVISKALRVGMDRAHIEKQVGRTRLGQAIERSGRSMSDIVATIVFWIIFLITLVYAISALEIPPLTASMLGILGFLPNVIAAAIIVFAGLLIGSFIGKGLEDMLPKYGVSGGRLIGLVVEVIIYLFALNLAIIQLGVGQGIIFVYSTALSWGIAAAVAIGVGGAVLFALKDVLPSMVSGSTTVASTLKPGQTITVEGIPDKGDTLKGKVSNVGMFNVILEREEGGYVVIPNELLANKAITVEGGEAPRPFEHGVRDRVSDLNSKFEESSQNQTQSQAEKEETK